ncbi:MAG: HAMP domain-containing sensor histidine kinase [Parcubacteria group bacterium]
MAVPGKVQLSDVEKLATKEKLGRLNWSVNVRYLVILVLFVMTLLGHTLGFSYDLGGILVAVSLGLAFNIASSFIYSGSRYPRVWPYLGIMLDMVVITYVVHYTGGVESIFLPLYFLQIVGSNVHFSRIAGPLNFLFGGGIFILLLVGEYQGFIPHISQPYFAGINIHQHTTYVFVLALNLIALMGISTYRSGYVVRSLSLVERRLFELNEELIHTNRAFSYANRRLKEIDQMKTEFISVASHQMRTPLSAIKWVIKMMLDGDMGPLTAEQRDLLSKGYQSNERMITLINDLLDVSRIDEGRFQYMFSRHDLVEIAQRVIDETHANIKARGVHFHFKPPENPLPKASIDEQKMHLVIQNLIDNAIKYTPKGGDVTVDVSQDEDKIRFSVKDTGAGIPERQQDRIFSKFFRADNVIRMQTEGSGLGLFIVKSIVEGHKGEIHFESREGVGSTFSFTLPVEGRGAENDGSFERFIKSM